MSTPNLTNLVPEIIKGCKKVCDPTKLCKGGCEVGPKCKDLNLGKLLKFKPQFPKWDPKFGDKPSLNACQQSINCMTLGYYYYRKVRAIIANLPQDTVADSNGKGFQFWDESNPGGHRSRTMYLERIPLEANKPKDGAYCACMQNALAEAPPISHWRIVVSSTGKLDPFHIVWECVMTDEGEFYYHMTKFLGLPDPSIPNIHIPDGKPGGGGQQQQNPGDQQKPNGAPPANKPPPQQPNGTQGKPDDHGDKGRGCCIPLPVWCPKQRNYAPLPASHKLGTIKMSDKEINEKALAVIKELTKPDQDARVQAATWGARLWLSLTPKSTSSADKKKQLEPGNYNRLWRNCQVFAIHLAMDTVGKKSPWDWVKLNVYFHVMPSSVSLLCCGGIY